MKKYEVELIYSTCRVTEGSVQSLACETVMSDNWRGLGMDGRLILKLTLRYVFFSLL